MDFLERDLEDILFNSNQELIQKRGLSCFNHDIIRRQVNLDTYGILDLVGINYGKNLLSISIYELKNKELSTAAFWQTVRYIKGVKRLLKLFNLSNHYVQVQGYMIGRSVDDRGEFCFLPTINSDISMFTYSYEINGIQFEPVNDTYFNNKFSPKIDISDFLM